MPIDLEASAHKDSAARFYQPGYYKETKSSIKRGEKKVLCQSSRTAAPARPLPSTMEQ